jgi:hypothetical protein
VRRFVGRCKLLHIVSIDVCIARPSVMLLTFDRLGLTKFGTFRVLAVVTPALHSNAAGLETAMARLSLVIFATRRN